jgi:uncharacterized membrane protein
MNMTDQERTDIPSEPAPEEGHEPSPVEEPSESSQHPEDRLADKIGETADSVTAGLRDLQDELFEPAAQQPAEVDAPAFDAASATSEPPLEPSPTVEPGSPEPLGVPPVVVDQSQKAAAPFTPEGSSDDRLMAMLAWLSMVILQLPVVSIIQLLSPSMKNQPFQRHHAVTSLLFFGAGIVYEILAVVVFSILTAVTLGCGAACLWVIFFVPHALGLYYAFQAYSGKRIDLPFLTDFAKGQGWM